MWIGCKISGCDLEQRNAALRLIHLLCSQCVASSSILLKVNTGFRLIKMWFLQCLVSKFASLSRWCACYWSMLVLQCNESQVGEGPDKISEDFLLVSCLLH